MRQGRGRRGQQGATQPGRAVAAPIQLPQGGLCPSGGRWPRGEEEPQLPAHVAGGGGEEDSGHAHASHRAAAAAFVAGSEQERQQ